MGRAKPGRPLPEPGLPCPGHARPAQAMPRSFSPDSELCFFDLAPARALSGLFSPVFSRMPPALVRGEHLFSEVPILRGALWGPGPPLSTPNQGYSHCVPSSLWPQGSPWAELVEDPSGGSASSHQRPQCAGGLALAASQASWDGASPPWSWGGRGTFSLPPTGPHRAIEKPASLGLGPNPQTACMQSLPWMS